MFAVAGWDYKRTEPIYRQISRYLREKITGGELEPGTRLPNAQELSGQFGVAYRTIIRALDVLKNEGLLIGIPSRGTFVRENANHLRNIAVVVSSAYHQNTGPEVEIFQRGISEECTRLGIVHQIFAVPGPRIYQPSQPTLLSQLIDGRLIDGLIAYAPLPLDDAARLSRTKMPFVVCRSSYSRLHIPTVVEDAREGARLLVRYLVAGLGHRRIGLLSKQGSDAVDGIEHPTRAFVEAVTHELDVNGIDIHHGWNAFSEGSAYAADRLVLRNLLTSAEPPTALICTDNKLAAEAVRISRELGKEIPRDMSIASYGANPSALELTCIDLPYSELARCSVRILDQIVHGKTAKSCKVPVTLMVRTSCGPVSCT